MNYFEEVGKYLEKYTFDYLMQEALSKVPDDIDKREGSIIYDALAPAMHQLAGFYIQLRYVLYDIFAHTASGEYLDMRVQEFGLSRIEATKAVKLGYFTNSAGAPINISVGTRFSTVEEIESRSYIVIDSPNTPVGTMYLECEESGSKGNRYNGAIVPLTNITGLGTATLGDSIFPARDEETDEELRQRFYIFANEKPFGGNFIDYVTETNSISGVGGCQVFPVWNGGGTVKVVVMDADYNPASTTLVNAVKTYLDPPNMTQEGGGKAPIGHAVTVAPPIALTINVSMEAELSGVTLEQVQPLITEQIERYFLTLRKNWSKFSANHKYYLYVYRAQIISAIVENVTGIANVKNVKLNNLEDDILVRTDKVLSQLPVVGGVHVIEIYSD